MMVRYPRLGLRWERLHSRSWNGTGCPCAPRLSRGRTPWMPPMNPAIAREAPANSCSTYSSFST